MVFRRLYKVLQANISTGTESTNNPASSQADAFNYEENKKQEAPVQDPLQIRELEYLSNLELKEGAGFEEVKLAYKRLIRIYHPDKFHNDEAKRKLAEEVTSKLNEAYAYFEKKHGKS